MCKHKHCVPMCNIVYHCVPLCTFIFHSIPLCTIVHLMLHSIPLCTIVHTLCFILYHCVPLCTIVYHCVPLWTIVYHCLPLCTIMYHCTPYASFYSIVYLIYDISFCRDNVFAISLDDYDYTHKIAVIRKLINFRSLKYENRQLHTDKRSNFYIESLNI